MIGFDFLLQQFETGNRWTVTLVLQANQLTKCASHPNNGDLTRSIVQLVVPRLVTHQLLAKLLKYIMEQTSKFA